MKAEKDQLLSMMKSDISTLDSKGGGGGRWASFWPAFLILLREGMEAILIIVAIMAYLAKSGNKKYLNTVYNNSIAAVIASFASAYVFSVVLDTFTVGASRELIEGLTALFAVFVLLYMSFWMGSRAKASAWKQYLETMIHTTITTGRARSLGLAAFLAVYREGAEVILFYQALFNGASGDTDMIWFGFLAGALVLAVIFVFIQLGLFKIPLRAFYRDQRPHVLDGGFLCWWGNQRIAGSSGNFADSHRSLLVSEYRLAGSLPDRRNDSGSACASSARRWDRVFQISKRGRKRYRAYYSSSHISHCIYWNDL